MLKVIIVDDEKIQREGILKHVAWKNYNMEVVGCVGDGIEALELIKIQNTDILITDVMMPKMNGLELSQIAREINPRIKILIISGYEEFEFARTAIELNANAYILKPINMGKLRNELEKISYSYRSELQEEEKINEMRKHLEDSKPLLKDKFIKDIVYGLLKEEEAIRKRSEFLQVNLPDSWYYTLLIDIDYSDENNFDEEKKLLLGLDLSRCLSEFSTRVGDCIVTQHKDNEFILLLFNNKLADDEVLLFIESMRTFIEERVNKPVTIGISLTKNNIAFVHESYKEAEISLKQKFYRGKGKCILYSDIITETGHSISLNEYYDELMSNVSIGDLDEVEDTVEQLFNLLSRPSVEAGHENYIKAFSFRAMSDMYRVLYDMNEKVENIFGEENILWSKIYRFDTIPDVRQWLKNIIMTVTRYIFNKKSKKNAGLVDTVKCILDERYYEQISVEELSKKVFLTPNYVSNLFRENMGESIIDYLTKVRMKHAQRLLAQSDLKIYEIAEKIGFNSVSYFSVVFKNAIGISPKDFRDSNSDGEK